MGRYKTIGMLKSGGMQKDINDYVYSFGTEYLLTNQRGVHLVTTNPQRLLVQGGLLMDTTGAHNGKFIFVMDGEGNIYSADKSVVNHHSAFLAGGPVASAGHWRVANGQVERISNVSGHYQPPIDYCKQILKELKRRRIPVKGIAQDWTGGTSKGIAKATKKFGRHFERMGPKGVVKGRF